MKIALMGDTHGFYPSVKRCLIAINKVCPEASQVYHLGDFAIYDTYDGHEYFDLVQARLENMGMYLLVTPGNHEDWDYINSFEHEEYQLRENIFILKRGWFGKADGTSFISLGGAPSVDRTARVSHGWPWSPNEIVTREDLERLQEADVMLAHDAPFGSKAIDLGIGGNPHGFALQDIAYANEGREMMTEAVNIVKPKVFFHGHYHFSVREKVTLPSGHSFAQYGLAADGKDFSCGIFDTTTLSYDPIVWDRNKHTPTILSKIQRNTHDLATRSFFDR